MTSEASAADAAARDQAAQSTPGEAREPGAATQAEPLAEQQGSGAAPPATGGSSLHDAPGESQAERQGTEPGEQPDATNAARELAEERGVDLSTIEGTGSGGRITQADVQKVADNPPGEGERADNDAQARAALEALNEEQEGAAAPQPKRVVVRDGFGLRSYETEDGEVYFRDVARDVSAERYEELGRYKIGGLRVLVQDRR